MNNKRDILIKGLVAIAAVIVICVSVSRIIGIGSETLEDIAREHPQPTSAPAESTAEPETAYDTEGTETDAPEPEGTETEGSEIEDSETEGSETEGSETERNEDDMDTDDLQAAGEDAAVSLTGRALNGELMADARVTWADGFYYEPLSEDLAAYITGISYPEDLEEPAILPDSLSYVHVLYCDFEGDRAEGELICNRAIAQDLVEIFHELYQAEYQLEKVRLIDEYGGDDDLSMADNNTSCFNYRVVSGSSSLSRHAYGLAVDVNPLYNPYITYNKDHTVNVAPAAGEDYADRSQSFPYKIDENDLCCRLFKEHGFTWGGDWNSCKDYQHFQKTIQ